MLDLTDFMPVSCKSVIYTEEPRHGSQVGKVLLQGGARIQTSPTVHALGDFMTGAKPWTSQTSRQCGQFTRNSIVMCSPTDGKLTT